MSSDTTAWQDSGPECHTMILYKALCQLLASHQRNEQVQVPSGNARPVQSVQFTVPAICRKDISKRSGIISQKCALARLSMPADQGKQDRRSRGSWAHLLQSSFGTRHQQAKIMILAICSETLTGSPLQSIGVSSEAQCLLLCMSFLDFNDQGN